MQADSSNFREEWKEDERHAASQGGLATRAQGSLGKPTDRTLPDRGICGLIGKLAKPPLCVRAVRFADILSS